MLLHCPKCRSFAVEPQQTGRMICGAIGATAGAVRGAQAVAVVTRSAVTLAAASHPAGLAAKTVLGALLGGFSGAVIGGSFGDVLDKTVTNNYRCLVCEHTFRVDEY